jgi:hypothetical protein
MSDGSVRRAPLQATIEDQSRIPARRVALLTILTAAAEVPRLKSFICGVTPPCLQGGVLHTREAQDYAAIASGRRSVTGGPKRWGKFDGEW